jgi:hypothetical protein
VPTLSISVDASLALTDVSRFMLQPIGPIDQIYPCSGQDWLDDA